MVFQQPNPFPENRSTKTSPSVARINGFTVGDMDELVESSAGKGSSSGMKPRTTQGKCGQLPLRRPSKQRLCIARAIAIEPEVDSDG